MHAYAQVGRETILHRGACRREYRFKQIIFFINQAAMSGIDWWICTLVSEIFFRCGCLHILGMGVTKAKPCWWATVLTKKTSQYWCMKNKSKYIYPPWPIHGTSRNPLNRKLFGHVNITCAWPIIFLRRKLSTRKHVIVKDILHPANFNRWSRKILCSDD